MFAAAEFADEHAYYRGQLGTVVGTARAAKQAARELDRRARGLRHLAAGRRRAASASCRSRAAASIASGMSGGRWAYVSALLDGFTDYIFMTVDMADPTQSARRRPLLDPRNEPRRRRDAELAGQPPLRPAPRHHRRRHRLCGLARRRHGGDRCRRPRATRSSSSTATGARRSAAARTIACRCRTAICWSCSTRPCSTTRRTASS